MLYTIVSIDDVLNQNLCVKCDGCERSSNPFDYIRTGYFIDNAALFGGSNNVSFWRVERRQVLIYILLY